MVWPESVVGRGQAGLHAHRTAGGHRHHRHPHRPAAAGRPEGAGGGGRAFPTPTTSSSCRWPCTSATTPTANCCPASASTLRTTRGHRTRSRTACPRHQGTLHYFIMPYIEAGPLYSKVHDNAWQGGTRTCPTIPAWSRASSAPATLPPRLTAWSLPSAPSAAPPVTPPTGTCSAATSTTCQHRQPGRADGQHSQVVPRRPVQHHRLGGCRYATWWSVSLTWAESGQERAGVRRISAPSYWLPNLPQFQPPLHGCNPPLAQGPLRRRHPRGLGHDGSVRLVHSGVSQTTGITPSRRPTGAPLGSDW